MTATLTKTERRELKHKKSVIKLRTRGSLTEVHRKLKATRNLKGTAKRIIKSMLRTP
ncbi:MAG: hypothetical protein WC659_06435 [Patescibacteria group bacterium]